MGDSSQMLIKTSQWLQERAFDTPTKGLLWIKPTGFIFLYEDTGGLQERLLERTCLEAHERYRGISLIRHTHPPGTTTGP